MTILSKIIQILLALSTTALSAATNPQEVEAGRKQFEARCVGCHGTDGTGGERGPDIVDVRFPRARSTESLRQLIRNGIPDAGMPSFHLSEKEMDELLTFVGSLKSPAINHPAPGNEQAGEQFFAGKGNCTHCHMVRGHGGVLGPDLTNLGRERRFSQIEQALRKPGLVPMSAYGVVSIRLRDGRRLRGIAKNETNYDLQLQDLSGVLHLLSKDQIAEEIHESKSLMPPVDVGPEEMRNLLAYLSRLDGGSPAPPPTRVSAPTGRPAFSEIVNPKSGEWPTYNGHLSGNRYSPLHEINTGNVATLAPRWIFTIPSRLEVTPVVVDGVMYVTGVDEAFALDAHNGRQIWHYMRPPTKGIDSVYLVNRGVAILGDRVFMVTTDAHLLALNRFTGELLWEVEMADFRQHYGATAAPLVVKDLVLSGTAGGDEGERGFIDAYRVSSGERVWRFWTIPTPDEPLAKTSWGGRAVEHGCATAWLTGTYDPESNLIYWPTGNPCPDFNGEERKGDNLYSNSVLALEPETGKLRWYYQFTPHDLHDWDATETPLLIDAEFRGQPRKLLVQANRNGFFYVLDRTNGELLLAQPFVKKLTWAEGIGKDGRPKLRPGSEPTPGGARVCPAAEGATNWMSTAYNFSTGLFYLMALERCAIYTKSSAWWELGQHFYGGAARHVPGEAGQKVLRALDIQTGKIVWELPQIGPANTSGGVLTTAGGLVFFCDDGGAFAAVDAKSGNSLWHFQTSQPWHASPMTYALDGKQYVTIAAGSNILAFGLP